MIRMSTDLGLPTAPQLYLVWHRLIRVSATREHISTAVFANITHNLLKDLTSKKYFFSNEFNWPIKKVEHGSADATVQCFVFGIDIH